MDKKKGVFSKIAEKYNEAAKSGKLGAKAKIAAEEKAKKKKRDEK